MEQITETALNQPITQQMAIEHAYGRGYFEGCRIDPSTRRTHFSDLVGNVGQSYLPTGLATRRAYREGYAFAFMRRQEQPPYTPPDGWEIVPLHERWAHGDHWSHGIGDTIGTPTPVSCSLANYTVAQLLQHDGGKGFILRRRQLPPDMVVDWGEIANGPVVAE